MRESSFPHTDVTTQGVYQEPGLIHRVFIHWEREGQATVCPASLHQSSSRWRLAITRSSAISLIANRPNHRLGCSLCKCIAWYEMQLRKPDILTVRQLPLGKCTVPGCVTSHQELQREGVIHQTQLDFGPEVSFRSPLTTPMILGSCTTFLSFKHLQTGENFMYFNDLL